MKLELADALNTVMRIKTNANCLVLEGTQDTPANKKLWRALGNEALPLATAAYKAMPGDVRALAVYADSFMYSCSAKGIVKQASAAIRASKSSICPGSCGWVDTRTHVRASSIFSSQASVFGCRQCLARPKSISAWRTSCASTPSGTAQSGMLFSEAFIMSRHGLSETRS